MVGQKYSHKTQTSNKLLKKTLSHIKYIEEKIPFSIFHYKSIVE